MMKSEGSGLMTINHCRKRWRSWQRILDSRRRESDSTAAKLGAGFHLMNICRVEQYKKQFKKWNWSKYLSTKEALWMENKAAERKREEKKDTIFQYRGQTYTEESLQQRLQRKKNQLEGNPIATGMTLPCPVLTSA
jgi:hypothetical protein